MSGSMYRSICVPLDGSPFAEQALPLALEIARGSGAILQVALVHHPVPALATTMEVPEIEVQLEQESRIREQDYLSGIVERMRKSANVPVTATLLDGAVTESLHWQIESSGADLLVMTTHGRGALSRFWLGSVADHLMRALHLPVLLVRPVAEAIPPSGLRRILLALDGSTFGEQAVAAATMLGRPFNAEYALMMVVEPPMPLVDPSGLMVVPTSAAAMKELKTAASGYLEGVAARLRKDGLRVTTHQIDAATAAGAIIAQADELKVDLIALASHGAGGFERLVVGSIADKVIRGSTHPTLVVRPPKDAH